MKTLSNNDIAESIFLSSKGKTGHELSLYSKNVVNFLNKRRLLSKAPAILARLEALTDIENGIVRAKIFSAHKLANQTKHALGHSVKQRYGAVDVVFDEVIDEKLLGGFKISVEDEVIDFTLKNKVAKLKEYLTETHE